MPRTPGPLHLPETPEGWHDYGRNVSIFGTPNSIFPFPDLAVDDKPIVRMFADTSEADLNLRSGATPFDEAEANAAHIVACWNAMEPGGPVARLMDVIWDFLPMDKLKEMHPLLVELHAAMEDK